MNAGLRRYPALGFMAVAAALALLLPSRLSNPRSDPATLAEFAPVPGDAEGVSQLSDLGEASSAARGSGARPTPAPPRADAALGGPPGRSNPKIQKRCVGNPPRQTEDPLSPPCVAFFEGKNGGSTSGGVTGEEVTVVVYQGAPSITPYGQRPAQGSEVDYSQPWSDGDFIYDYAMKVYARYFNERYQTYDRYVRLIGYWGSGSSTDQARRADAQHVISTYKPFATISVATNPVFPYVTETAARDIVSVSFDTFEREAYTKQTPMLWSVLPDLEDEAALTAGYVCRKLKGRTARHSGNDSDRERTRVFGMAYTESADDPQFEILKDLIEAELRKCGIELFTVPIPSGNADGTAAAPGAIAQLQANGVTTVIVQSTALYVTTAASAARWYPEWFVPGRRNSSSIDQAGIARTLPRDQWEHAFGITYVARWGDEYAQHWSRSYRETCGCEQNARYWTSTFYDPLAMLFYGIQAAGPRLTPQNFEKGLYAIPPRAAVDPYTPASYFTRGNYTYLKDAMEIWWDPNSTGPGDDKPGCYHIPNDGARFRADEWRGDDTQLFRDGPCNGAAPYP